MTFLATLRGKLRLKPLNDDPYQRAHGDRPTLPRGAVVRSFVDTSITDFDFNHEPENRP